MTDCDDQENYIDVQSTLTINGTIVNTIEIGLINLTFLIC